MFQMVKSALCSGTPGWLLAKASYMYAAFSNFTLSLRRFMVPMAPLTGKERCKNDPILIVKIARRVETDSALLKSLPSSAQAGCKSAKI